MSLELRGLLEAKYAEPVKVTKVQFFTYEKIRQSGATNMFLVDNVISLSGGALTKPVCLNIMKHYSFLRSKYLKA